ncbi:MULTISPECIES: hypothetical protein [unclassified Alistipes]|jgi:ABC-type glycerol-3-phosphate transport system substrate-binding protein|uniref:hypothetical protein n=1 Tax=unclassified Alistipes TaxID=2608932 RepID=UPI001178A9D1|nr:hypothetical protein [Alistipes sp. An31A]HIV32704.1 hypothetical protein [Candidatus Alistipes excrementigallinarum]
MKRTILLLAAAVALSACSNSVYKSHTARVARIPAAMESMVNVSDLEVSETKVTGICTGKDGKYLSKKVKEQNAIAEALKKTGADILVEPQFTYTYDKKGRLTTVEVSGYPARYRNFRSLTKEDAEAINALRNPSTQQQVLMLPVVQK